LTKEGLVSFSTSARLLPQRFRLVLTSFLQHAGLPFAEVLPEERIQAAFDEAGVDFATEENDVYTPSLTLWAFLSQVLHKQEQRSCSAAVARVVVVMVALGRKISDNTGAYCRARAKLPEVVLQRLTQDLARGCEESAPKEWLWCGRPVKFGDGTTLSMPDTKANQEAYPQHGAQAQGLGFPIARMMVVMSFATAMLLTAAIGPYQGKETGETALLRQLFPHFKSGDVFLADRYHCSYFMIALLRELGVDCVVRLHQLRTADFRRGEHLGKGDHLVKWLRPDKPNWMDQETYDRIPTELTIREVQVQVNQPGFRVENFVVVTTLQDAVKYSRESLAELYRKRWLVELDIRAIKSTMGMDVLRCQTPEMVRREIWTCLLAYNLTRQTMLQTALQSGRSPRSLSFTTALQKITAGYVAILVLDVPTQRNLSDTHLDDLQAHKVGHRPDRVEPRAIKRRPKPQKLLTVPRDEARAALLKNPE
jgi:putative transposase